MSNHRPTLRVLVLTIAALVAGLTIAPTAQTGVAGLREPAWAPDGKHLAVVFLDRIWTVLPDGREAHELTRIPGTEREPAWSPDGKRIAFAADRGSGFDVYVVPARGGAPQRITTLEGDERSPSWTPDGRLVFSYRASGSRQWDLFLVDVDGDDAARTPIALTQTPDDEVQPRVSPDGRRVAFVSNRDNDDGDFDIWIMRLFERGVAASRDPRVRRGPVTRLERARGYDGYPTWSPQGDRLAYYAVRDGVGSTWVASVSLLSASVETAATARPDAPPVLVSRHGGSLSWSPDGQTLAIGEIPDPDRGYNGDPAREAADPPPLFGLDQEYQLWTVTAPRPVDAGGRVFTPVLPADTTALTRAFDSVWSTLERLYYSSGDGARAWDGLRARFRPMAEQARTAVALEQVIDQLVASEPLIKPEVTSTQAVVVSAHPLASEAGRQVLERGGNIVDAAIAVSLALGVVEPDASGLGGDGQALLVLTGMAEPTVIEYKDETPRAATLDNPRIFRSGRLVGDGPASANIPGLAAGLDYLYTHYGSGRIGWSDLVAPAIRYAEDGFVLDQTLPSTIAEGRQYLQKYAASARIFLPNRQVPRAGDRFVNRDLASTLRVLAGEGADSFYRGSIAQRIANDMATNGGLITADDLAQYHAIERKPVSARYRDYVLYTGGPPVGAGVSLLEAFEVLANYSPRPHATPVHDADYFHYLIEAWKARDRIARIADPARWAVDYEQHLQPMHAAELFRRIKRDTASRYPDDSDEPLAASERIGSGTTAIVIADGEGNMIAVTNTLSTWGGSFYVSRGLGFLYNNHLRSNRTIPGAYGQLMPLTRSNTANVPLLAFREEDGRAVPAFGVGVAGNAWIPASTYSIVTGLIDGGLSMQQAVEAPRFLVTRDLSDGAGNAARVEIEDRFPRDVLQDLIARGHRFEKIGRKGELRYGYASGVLVDPGEHLVEGGADPRRSHAAVAVDSSTRISQ
jgi:gamma-glutamyltranspeptidase